MNVAEAVHDTVRNHKRPPEADAITNNKLASLVQRIENRAEERFMISSDIKDMFTEAKSAGFDAKVLRRLIRERKQDPDKLEEMENLLDLYRREIGMI